MSTKEYEILDRSKAHVGRIWASSGDEVARQGIMMRGQYGGSDIIARRPVLSEEARPGVQQDMEIITTQDGKNIGWLAPDGDGHRGHLRGLYVTTRMLQPAPAG